MKDLANTPLEKVTQDFLAAIQNGDKAAILSYYTDDAIVQPPMGDVVRGKDGLDAYWSGIVSQPMGQLTYTPVALDYLGDDYASELSEFDDGNGFKGRYAQLWRRETDGWKLFHDTYNMIAV